MPMAMILVVTLTLTLIRIKGTNERGEEMDGERQQVTESYVEFPIFWSMTTVCPQYV